MATPKKSHKKKSELYVLKFGGSSLSTPEKIRNVAGRIAELAHDGRSLIVVVSAMGTTTDELMELAHRVSAHPHRRELDMLLTTGERISMTLMSMALHDFGAPSISFTGSQAGVFTDGSFSNAEIVDIKPIRVAEELKRGRVVVLAGFQGVDPRTKEITTLGRGGSDTTAVAMAAKLGAKQCEIYKDVDGILGADPKIISNPPLYDEIPLPILYDFCFWGAKILNVRSVEWAMKARLPIFIGRSSDFSLGTIATAEVAKNPKKNIVGLHSHSRVLELIVKESTVVKAVKRLNSELQAKLLPEPQILLSEKLKGALTRLFVTLDSATIEHIEKALMKNSKIRIARADLSSVTLTQLFEPLRGSLSDLWSGPSYHRCKSGFSETYFVDELERPKALKSLGQKLF